MSSKYFLLSFFVLTSFLLSAQPTSIELIGCDPTFLNDTYTSMGAYTGSDGSVSPTCPCYESDSGNGHIVVNRTFITGNNWVLHPGTCTSSLGPGYPLTANFSEPFDSDCDITNEGESCITAVLSVPTLNQWALCFLFLSLLIIGVVALKNWELRSRLGLTSGGIVSGYSFYHFPFNLAAYNKCLKKVLLLAPLGFLFIYFVWGEIIIDDVIGMAVVIPMIGYLIYLLNNE